LIKATAMRRQALPDFQTEMWRAPLHRESALRDDAHIDQAE
jgi:hypothetical protein